MKRITFVPLLCALAGGGLTGCSAPAPQNSGAAPISSAPASAAPASSSPAAAPAAPSTSPAKTYRIARIDGVRLAETEADDAAIHAALKKVALAPPPLDTKIPAHPRVVMATSKGAITLELDAKAAPLHVRSFLYLAGKGFYNGVKFHRYADLLGNGQGFIIQGGDPLSKNAATAQFAGRGGPGYEVPREYNDLKHQALIIAAARSSDPDSAGSQFYITQNAVPFLDEGDGYTVFGKVIKGQSAALALRENDEIRSVLAQK